MVQACLLQGWPCLLCERVSLLVDEESYASLDTRAGILWCRRACHTGAAWLALLMEEKNAY